MCFAAAGLWHGLRGKDRHTWTLASQYRAQASEVWLEYCVVEVSKTAGRDYACITSILYRVCTSY